MVDNDLRSGIGRGILKKIEEVRKEDKDKRKERS
jgi:hypothetical protein